MLAAAIAASMEQLTIDEQARKEDTSEKNYLLECMVLEESKKEENIKPD